MNTTLVQVTKSNGEQATEDNIRTAAWMLGWGIQEHIEAIDAELGIWLVEIDDAAAAELAECGTLERTAGVAGVWSTTITAEIA
jgi:hypothetical protein